MFKKLFLSGCVPSDEEDSNPRKKNSPRTPMDSPISKTHSTSVYSLSIRSDSPGVLSPLEEGGCKVLLLGSGESGKSTLCFQIRALKEAHNDTVKRAQLYESYKSHVCFNLFTQTLRIATGIMSKTTLDPKTEKLITELTAFCKDEHPRSLLEKLEMDKKKDGVYLHYYLVNDIWKDPTIQQFFHDKDGFYYFPGSEYFFHEDTILRIGKVGYVPMHEDVLYTRKKTTGITEYKIVEYGMVFRLIDVGGQKNERKKWKNCMQNVEILIYVISLASFDEKLYEDATINSMKESLDVWNQTMSGEWFRNTQIMIVFNKYDLLKSKITEKDTLRPEFSDYVGGTDPEAAKKYIMNLFLKDHESDPRVTVVIGSALEEETSIMVADTMIKLKK
jgi:guanine nucleotide-binding protein G(i) subunit alpha